MSIENLIKVSEYFGVSLEFLFENVLNVQSNQEISVKTSNLEQKRKERVKFDKQLGTWDINHYVFEEWIFENDDYLKAFIFGYMSYKGYSELRLLIDDDTEEILKRSYTGYVKK